MTTYQIRHGVRSTITNAEELSLSLDLVDRGTLYFNTDLGILRMWNGVAFIDAPTSGQDKNFIFVQGTVSAFWVIPHNLGKYPSVTVVDNGGTTVEGHVEWLDTNNITITFSSGFAGKAYLN